MYSAPEVDELFEKWKNEGCTKEQLIIKTGEAELGWPYVWGAVAAQCTPEKRDYYAKRPSCPAGEVKQIYKTCQCYNEDGTRTGKYCGGCQFYPNNMRTLIDDCQGFVKQLCSRVGISLAGGGASSMWRTASNWSEKGEISTLPEKLCCIFWQNASDKSVMNHVGFYVGGGMMIHCSGTVKKEKLSKKVTHWAIPKGLGGDTPMPTLPTLRRGSTGEYVTLLQTKLIQLGYDVGATGADGRYGAKTEAAVKAFQKDHGLVADGITGPRTWEALDAGQVTRYTVMIQHLSKSVAEDLVNKYGGTMTAEEG